VLARHGLSSAQFAERLLQDVGVAVIDGTAFGARGEGRVRLSFASATAELDQAVTRIAECARSL
jgi:aspartate/methionine/tyrosine aminotransferase